MCSLAEFEPTKFYICTNLQKSTLLESKYFLVGMELLGNAQNIREMDFRDLPQIWK